MIKKDIKLNILPIESSIKEVLNALEKGAYGIVFIVDQEEKVCGIFTDGDVRRALLQGVGLGEPVSKYMVKDFVYDIKGKSKDGYLKMMAGKVRHLPILNRKRQLIDFLSWAEMWRLPIMEPTLGGNELKYVSDCITSNWISSQGEYVRSFEENFSKYHESQFAVAVSSGTAALHLALVALDIGLGDEVIVPDLTFGASANTVIHSGATPVFVDVHEKYWNIDPAKIGKAITAKTKAIMAVHLYGHPCEMDIIMQLAKKHDLYVIEDCAEALGAKFEGKLVGTFGHVGCFSFFSNKVITTGEGGMIIGDSLELHEKLTLWRDHGMKKNKRYWHEVPGFNYRMTNLQAAVGLAQLEQIEDFIAKRRIISKRYRKGLEGIPGITHPPEEDWAFNIYWLYSILIDEGKIGVSRAKMIQSLEREGIETRPLFYSLHIQPPYPKTTSAFPVSDRLSRQGLSLPSGNGLGSEEIQRVCNSVKRVLHNIRT